MEKSSTLTPTGIPGLVCCGMVSFFVGALAADILIVHLDNYILGLILAGAIAGILLSLLLRWPKKMVRIVIASIIGMPVCLLLSFFLVEGVGSLLPADVTALADSSAWDVVAIVVMGIIFGGVFGGIVFGAKTIIRFSVVCGMTAIPFGLLVAAMNSGFWMKDWLGNLFGFLGNIDLNLLAILVSLGLGTGLSIGLVSKRRKSE